MTQQGAHTGGIALLFPRGGRPAVADVVARIAATAEEGSALLPIGMGHIAADAGLCEVIVAGLCLDLRGLVPASSAALPDIAHRFGLSGADVLDDCETIVLTAGDHIASGAHLLPVVRAMCAAAAVLTGIAGCVAVVWRPAATATAAPVFAQLVNGWLQGGAFPAPGLVAIAPHGENAIVSVGLAFFTGQEIQFDLTSLSDRNRIGKIAARIIHRFVESDPLSALCTFAGPGGERLTAEPIEDGRIVHIWDAN